MIIGSPTYASNVSGQLKQFIDRGHFVIWYHMLSFLIRYSLFDIKEKK
ncbi:MAG: hypothetical protein HDQ97_13285 [Lachnospiraceae bacterium]|nr:hypothetical protein [Lachnospiraceae bacterium]